MALRFLVVILIWLVLQAYAGRALAALARILGMRPGVGWTVSALVAVLPVVAMTAYRANAIGIDSAWQWAGFISMGFASILFFASVAGDLTRLAVAVLRRVRPASARWSAGRARSSAQLVAGTGAILAALLTVGGLFVAWRPMIVEATVPIANLDPRLNGLRIALLSDIHVGPLVTSAFAHRVTRLTNGIDPDIVMIAGDLVDGTPEVLEPHVAPLGGMRSRHGVYYVNGNHEYYWDADGWLQTASRLGWKVLGDSHDVIRHNGADLVVAGVYDLRASTFNPEHAGKASAALDGAPENAFTILLSHQPQSGFGAEHLGVDLHLAGHTHGGQYFPFNLLVHAFQPIVRGLHARDEMRIYVTPGTGFWGPPNRLGSRGRIVHLTLRPL